MFLRSIVMLLALALAAAPVFAESRPEAPNGEPLPHVEGMSAKEIATIAAGIVAASIAAYRQGGSGPCACPDDRDSRGSRCGKRSARDRPGGWTVYCYLSDVPAALIKTKAAKNPVSMK